MSTPSTSKPARSKQRPAQRPSRPKPTIESRFDFDESEGEGDGDDREDTRDEGEPAGKDIFVSIRSHCLDLNLSFFESVCVRLQVVSFVPHNANNKIIIMKEGIRIAKAIAQSGRFSRRAAERLIAERRVAVNGALIDSPALNVRPTDRVRS